MATETRLERIVLAVIASCPPSYAPEWIVHRASKIATEIDRHQAALTPTCNCQRCAAAPLP